MIYLLILILCIICPQTAVYSAKQSILIWYNSILPITLPYTLTSHLVLNSGILYKLSKPFSKALSNSGIKKDGFLIYAVSILFGYPLGAVFINQTVANKTVREKLCTVCFCANPVYVIYSIGICMMNCVEVGIALEVINVCSSLIFASFFKIDSFELQYFPQKAIKETVTKSIEAVLAICGFLVFFRLIISFFQLDLLPFPLNAFLCGIIENTSGIYLFSQNESCLPYICFLLSFGGASMIIQTLQISNADKTKFILSRTVNGLISVILCVIYKKTALFAIPAITLAVITVNHTKRLKNTKNTE